MLRQVRQKTSEGQTLLEYAMIIGVVSMIFMAMSPMLKRVIQGMIKVTADQIGNQEGSEQKFDESGHTNAAYSTIRGSVEKTTEEFLGVTSYWYNDTVTTDSTTVSNLGFTKEN